MKKWLCFILAVILCMSFGIGSSDTIDEVLENYEKQLQEIQASSAESNVTGIGEWQSAEISEPTPETLIENISDPIQILGISKTNPSIEIDVLYKKTD